MGVRIQDRDLGFSRIVRDLEITRGAEITVGYHQDAGQHEGGISFAELMTVHEFGAPSLNIPMRSILRAVVDANRRRYIDISVTLQGRVVDGSLSPRQAADQFGAIVAADMKARFGSSELKELKAATIARKARTVRLAGERADFIGGSGNPLIDTTALRDALIHKVANV